MPDGLTLRGAALPTWFQHPEQRLPFITWWQQGLWARDILKPVPTLTSHGLAPVLDDLLAWADEAVFAPWCRQDVGHALKAWAMDVHHRRMKSAWEHAADLEALLTLVRPNVDDPRLLRWAHPDAVWSAWSRWDQTQREHAGRWLALQASALMVMGDWWRRACAPDDRPGSWYGVPNAWSITVQPGWVARWGDRVNLVVQTMLLNAHLWPRTVRLHWVRWMDRMLFETWPRHGLDDSDLLPVACEWHKWVRQQPWRAERTLSPSDPQHPPLTWKVAPPRSSLNTPVDSGVALDMCDAVPEPVVARAIVPPNAWGSAAYAPIDDAMNPIFWPQDTTLWWLHRKGDRTPATDAWNTLWTHGADRVTKVRAMRLLSQAYEQGLHGLTRSARCQERWHALFDHARRPSPEWIAADMLTAQRRLRWTSIDDDGTLAVLVQNTGRLDTLAQWCEWLGWNPDTLQPCSATWSATWAAYRAVLRHGRRLLRGPDDEGLTTWTQRWSVWIDAALAWETTLSKLPTVGDAWAQQFRERVTRRLMASVDALPRQESWPAVNAWLSGEVKPFAAWELTLLRPAHVNRGPVRVLAQEPTLDRAKETDLRVIVDRVASLWSPGCEMLPAPAAAADLALTLNEEYPWMDRVTQRLTRRLAMRHTMGSSFRLPNLLLVGAPGIGKTSYLRALAATVGVPFGVLSLNGMTDNRLLAGTARGYSNMRPGWAVEFVARERCANPLLVLDEIDKVAQGQQTGRVWDTLLGLTETSSSRTWFDECLLTPVDLSGVSWLATANSVEGMPDALLSRFEVLHVEAPVWNNRQHRQAALRRIRRDLAAEWGCDLERMPWITAAQEEALWTATSEGSSLRHLARAIESTIEVQVLRQGVVGRANHEPDRSTSIAPVAPPSASTQDVPWHTWAHTDPSGG